MSEKYSETQISKSVWGNIIIDYARNAVLHAINLTENSLKRLSEDAKLYEKLSPLFEGDKAYFTLVQKKFAKSSWDEIVRAVSSFEVGRMTAPKRLQG